MTLTSAPTRIQTQQPVLRLRGAPDRNERRIQWAEDVVDNEGLGRKKSKGLSPPALPLEAPADPKTVCCIYHAPKTSIDDSSSESSSDSSSSDSDSDSGDDGAARPVGGKRIGGHRHGKDCGHGHDKKKKRAPSPNAYEKMPKPKNKPVPVNKPAS